MTRKTWLWCAASLVLAAPFAGAVTILELAEPRGERTTGVDLGCRQCHAPSLADPRAGRTLYQEAPLVEAGIAQPPAGTGTFDVGHQPALPEAGSAGSPPELRRALGRRRPGLPAPCQAFGGSHLRPHNVGFTCKDGLAPCPAWGVTNGFVRCKLLLGTIRSPLATFQLSAFNFALSCLSILFTVLLSVPEFSIATMFDGLSSAT